jgi:beta-mannosidase
MPLAEAKIGVEQFGNAIRLSVDKPAFFVWANVLGVRGEFDDNSFTLLPGRPKTLIFSGTFDSSRLTVSDLSSLVMCCGEISSALPNSK